MKALILAAGYGKRLQDDLREFNEYKEFLDIPKPLIQLGGKHLIDYLVEQIKNTGKVDEIYVVTNSLYFEKFKDWAKESGFPLDNIVNDGTKTNETRKGAVKDISIVVEEKKIEDDLLIMAGDTIFDCDLGQIISYFQDKGNTVMYYKILNDEEISKRGILELDETDRITNFKEKPDPSETKSRKACPPLYIYKKETLNELGIFLKQNLEIRQRDAPGNFVKWLVDNNVPIYGTQINGRHDVGNLEDLKKVTKEFEKK